jgi:VanZ family protein
VRSSKSATASEDGSRRARSARRRFILAYFGLVLVVTLVPLPSKPEVAVLPGLDKLVHGALFAGLAFLLHRELRGRPGSPLLAAGLATLTAALIELVQQPLPYRSGDARDLLAGMLGAVVGAAVSVVTLRRRHRGSAA